MRISEGRIILFFIIVTLAASFPGRHLFAQSGEYVPASNKESGGRFIDAGLDCADLLRRIDADKDGFITQEEWNRAFADNDEDGNKRLSPDEIQRIVGQIERETTKDPNAGRLAAFERLDKNRNDAIDPSEWPGKDQDFRYLDADRNGLLSREEFLSRNGRWWNMPFESLDFDGNGIIVRSEWLDSDHSFDMLDRDRNGVMERHEFYSLR